MEIVIGLLVLGLWLFAIAACTDLGWKMRPVRAAMLFFLGMRSWLDEMSEKMQRRLAEQKRG